MDRGPLGRVFRNLPHEPGLTDSVPLKECQPLTVSVLVIFNLSTAMNYDAWRTTNPADEQAAAYELERDKLAVRLKVSPDQITNEQLNEHLAELEDAAQAAAEWHHEAESERRLDSTIDALYYQRDMRAELEPETKPYEGY
jgi:hypothetical protein